MDAYNIFELDGLVFYGDETEAEITWYEETGGYVDFIDWCLDNLKRVYTVAA